MNNPTVDDMVDRHRRACAGFARVAHAVAPEAWAAPTPCIEWTARDVVEHVIDALTTDVLVHTWDLASAVGAPAALDDELCRRAYATARASTFARAEGMIGPEIVIAADAPVADKLVAFFGRDPEWAADG